MLISTVCENNPRDKKTTHTISGFQPLTIRRVYLTVKITTFLAVLPLIDFKAPISSMMLKLNDPLRSNMSTLVGCGVARSKNQKF